MRSSGTETAVISGRSYRAPLLGALAWLVGLGLIAALIGAQDRWAPAPAATSSPMPHRTNASCVASPAVRSTTTLAPATGPATPARLSRRARTISASDLCGRKQPVDRASASSCLAAWVPRRAPSSPLERWWASPRSRPRGRADQMRARAGLRRVRSDRVVGGRCSGPPSLQADAAAGDLTQVGRPVAPSQQRCHCVNETVNSSFAVPASA